MSLGWQSNDPSPRTNPLANKPKPAKRQKQVYNSSEIPHLWAHQTQESARNAQGNFYFDGATIYSYGAHFPIATIVKNKKGETAYLITTRGYSNTTAGHISAVRQSIPSSATKFYVALDRAYSAYKHSHNDTIYGYQLEIERAVKAGNEAKGMKWSHYLIAYRKLDELQRYVEFFGLPKMSEKARIKERKLPHLPVSHKEALEKYTEREAKLQEQSAARRARERAEYEAAGQAWIDANPERQRMHAEGMNLYDIRMHFWNEEQKAREAQYKLNAAERERKAVENIDAWRRGETVSLYGLPYSHPTMLRVKDSIVETSKGANFPVEHARRGLALVRSVIARGEEWKTNGHTCHLGHYKIDQIEIDGTVHAGCHVVSFSEIERVADQIES